MEAFKEAIAAAKEQSLDNDLGNNDVENRKNDGLITSSSSLVPSLFLKNKAKDDEEDQEIANCLILLAQGNSLPHPNLQLKIPYYHQTNNNNAYRVSSKRFLETSSSKEGGYYVYQCKTCDRTFPSFQALGGHRTSHNKKPKATSYYSNIDHNNKTLALQGKSSSNKVHECGVCGVEFTSGQALGGHMRRHRVVVVVTAAPLTVRMANTELTLSPLSFNQTLEGQEDHMVMELETKRAKKTIMSLDLDLNYLPAPEDENKINGFSLTSKQKHELEEHQHKKQRAEPKSLVLASPTLVDCHY